MNHNLFANKNSLFSFEAFTSNKNPKNNVMLLRILDNNNNKEYFLLDSSGHLKKVDENFIKNNFKKEKGVEYLKINTDGGAAAASNSNTNEKFLKVRMKEDDKNFNDISHFIRPDLRNKYSLIEEEDENSLITKDIFKITNNIQTRCNQLANYNDIFKFFKAIKDKFEIDGINLDENEYETNKNKNIRIIINFIDNKLNNTKDLEDEIEKLKKEIEELKASNDKKVTELNDQITALTKEIERLNKLNKEINDLLIKTQAEIDVLASLLSKLPNFTAEKNSLDEQLRKLEEEKAALEKRLSDCEESLKNSRLTDKEIDDLKKQINDLTQKNIDINGLLIETQAKIDELVSLLGALPNITAENIVLNEKLIKLEEDKAALEKSLSECNESLATITAENKRLIAEKETLKREFEEKIKELTEKIAELTANNESLNASNIQLTNRLKTLHDKLEKWLHNLNGLNDLNGLSDKSEDSGTYETDILIDNIITITTLIYDKLKTDNQNLNTDKENESKTNNEKLNILQGIINQFNNINSESAIDLSIFSNDLLKQVEKLKEDIENLEQNEQNEQKEQKVGNVGNVGDGDNDNPDKTKGSKEYNINNFIHKLNNNLFTNNHDLLQEAKYIIENFDNKFDINKFEQMNIEFLLQLKNFENILYKENNGFKDENLNRVDFLDMYDNFKNNVNLHISHNYKNVLNDTSVYELQNILFNDKTHAIIIDNFKNIFYNIMLNNINPNTKIYKNIKNELIDFFSIYFKDKKKTNLYSDDLVHNIFYNFNKTFNKLFKNKLNIDYFNMLKHNNNKYFTNLQKNIMGGSSSNDIDDADQADNYLLPYNKIIGNKYFIYILIIINIFIFYILFKIVKALTKKILLPIFSTSNRWEEIYI